MKKVLQSVIVMIAIAAVDLLGMSRDTIENKYLEKRASILNGYATFGQQDLKNLQTALDTIQNGIVSNETARTAYIALKDVANSIRVVVMEPMGKIDEKVDAEFKAYKAANKKQSK